ncbi:MAG: hypothetical protein IT276_14785 [Ignavibacteriaceae bacterium]|nr:hypothetical protein [Ignavibacteriaceae bacterium]
MRKDLKKLISLAGHDWYCQHSFQENITERYLNYVRTISQYERLHIKVDDLLMITRYLKQLSIENRQKELHEGITTLLNYVELDKANDLFFIVGNNFLYIDDEPIDTISAKHYQLKKQLYDDIASVKLFFCEVASSLMRKSQSLNDPFTVYQNITDRVQALAEMDYSELMSKASTVIQEKK